MRISPFILGYIVKKILSEPDAALALMNVKIKPHKTNSNKNAENIFPDAFIDDSFLR
jgi:hypothetical protein